MYIALSPGDIKTFFEPRIKWAVKILENFERCASKPSDIFNQYRHPVITVSIVAITKTVHCLVLGRMHMYLSN